MDDWSIFSPLVEGPEGPLSAKQVQINIYLNIYPSNQ